MKPFVISVRSLSGIKLEKPRPFIDEQNTFLPARFLFIREQSEIFNFSWTKNIEAEQLKRKHKEFTFYSMMVVMNLILYSEFIVNV